MKWKGGGEGGEGGCILGTDKLRHAGTDCVGTGEAAAVRERLQTEKHGNNKDLML